MSPNVRATDVPDGTSDEELMARFREGDTRALEALFNRHARPVHGFVKRMVRDDALADDLVQQTFLSVVRSADRFRPGARVWPWLLTIAANAARGTLRRDHIEVTGEAAAEPFFTPAHSDPGARRRIEAAFAQLPPAQREAVLLHKIDGLSFDEVAQVLGISSTAARIRAHRGYEALKPLLEELA